jgi:ABC-type lipoprotein release transport system permease subunit
MRQGGWSAARLWASTVIRRGWKALVVLGILAGVTGALAMAAFAGARRTDTALARLRADTNAADAIVFASQTGVPHPDWSKLRARPEVTDLAVWDLMFGNQDGQPGGLLFLSHDGAWGDTLTKPDISEGRTWDPSAPDEVIVTPAIAPFAPVGSTFTFQPFTSDQPESAQSPTGPVVTFHVVGVGTTVNRFLFTDGQIFVGPGFAAKYGSQLQLLENADVRLRNGSADVPALQRDVNEFVHAGTPVLDLNAVTRRVDTSIGVERTSLLVLAAAVAIAGGFLVAQALGRSAGRIGEDALALRTLGMSRREMVAATVYAHALVAVAALIVAAGGAIAASRFFPVGLGRQIDPNVGTHADLAVVVPGTMLVVAAVLVGSALAARRASQAARLQVLNPSRLAAAIRSASPVTVGVGAGMALEPGAGRSRVSVRPALLGAIVGVVGVVGTLTIEHSVTDALAHPERAGVTWDAQLDPLTTDYGSNGLSPDLLAKVAAAVPPGTGITEGARLLVPVDGVGVPTLEMVPFGTTPAAPALTLISGRAPTRDSEAAIGPKTAADLGVGIGDTVTVGDAKLPVTIVGEALFPNDVHSEFDEGFWLTPAAFERVLPAFDPAQVFTGPQRGLFLKFPPGTDVTAAITDLNQALAGTINGVGPGDVPVELTNLRNVRSLPIVLAVFLALLAMAAVSHVLVSSSHRRGHDLAVLRAIGMTRRSSRLAVNAQASVIAAVGLLLGIPLGIVSGRVGWRLVAERVPLQDVGPMPALALVLVVPIALVLLNTLAIWPARTVAQLRPAEVLRDE